ncbi:hypothetical protein FQN49_007131 [Arthroderma sp. PD_2]|nr:hypothetical protein FQN49_007131 [Arthroderma sp. PD_2]
MPPFKRPNNDEPVLPNAVKRLRKADEPHIYKNQLSKWGIPDAQTDINVEDYLISKIYQNLAETVSMQHVKGTRIFPFEQRCLQDKRRTQGQALIDMLLPIVNGFMGKDPSISTTPQNIYEAHPMPWGYCSDPWDRSTLLMRNRWYRFYEKTPDLEYMLILVQAEAFREMLWDLEPKLWYKLLRSLDLYRTSIKVFAEVIHLDFRWPFVARIGQHPTALSYGYLDGKPLATYHPHSIVINDDTDGIYKPMDHAHEASFNLTSYLYTRLDWPESKNWSPETTNLLLHTGYTHVDGKCGFCQQPNHLCWFKNPEEEDGGKINPPFFQLMECNVGGGITVRSLVKIEEGVTLGIFTGKLMPPNFAGDPDYSLNLTSVDSGDVIAVISARTNGNWTRFLNHSCEANTKFKPETDDSLPVMTVVTTMRIEPMEEITIDYGDRYFRDPDWVCCCRMSSCPHAQQDEKEPVCEGSAIEYRDEKGERFL